MNDSTLALLSQKEHTGRFSTYSGDVLEIENYTSSPFFRTSSELGFNSFEIRIFGYSPECSFSLCFYLQKEHIKLNLNKVVLLYFSMEENEYDIIIVGGGCAGYPCAVYAKRFNLKTLVIAKERGGLITTTHLVENYPGFISVTGQELGDALQAHVVANDVPISDDQVDSIEEVEENGKKYFIVKTGFLKKEYKTKTVVLATGTKHKHLGAPGEAEFAHKGVSYCATCDGPFFRNKEAIIVGGSDSAAKEAMVLSSICSKVTMLVRSKLRAEPINADRVRAIKNIEIIEGVQVKEIKGEKTVTSVLLDNDVELPTSCVFIAIGMLPQSGLAKELGVELNAIGEVKIDRLSQTNVEGVYSAGDVTDSEWKQGIIGSAEGSVAAYSAFEHIQKYF